MSDETKGPRERVYDAEIRPLVDEIFAICQREGIPFAGTFELDGGPDAPLYRAIVTLKNNVCLLLHDVVWLIRSATEESS